MKTIQNMKSDPCLDDVMLAKYLGGRASEHERKQIEEHLSACKDCLDMLVMANSLIRDRELSECEPVSEEVAISAMKRWNLYQNKERKSLICEKEKVQNRKENIAEKFQKIYQWLTDMIMPVQPALQRSSRQSGNEFRSCPNHSLFKDFKDFATEINFEKSEDDFANITVSIVRDKENVIRLTLENDAEEEIDSRPLKRDSEIFGFLEFGDYRLIFRKNTLDETLLSFTIDAAGIYEK